MSYSIVFSNTSAKQFQKLSNKKLKERISIALEYIANEPFIGKPLQAEFKGCYSYRVGDFRIIYTFHKENKILNILKVDHRRQSYR